MKHTRIQRYLPALLAAILTLTLFSGCSSAPTSPDAGKMVAYIDETGLMLRRLDGEESVQLAKGTRLAAPVFSGDGKYVYFKNTSDMFSVSTDGGRAMLAAADAVYLREWNGKALFLSRTTGVTAYDPTANTSETVIAQPETGNIGAMSLSPDGTRAVYSVEMIDAGVQRLMSVCVTVPGAAEPDIYPASMFPSARSVTPLAWSPDGRVCYLGIGDSDGAFIALYAFSVFDGSLSNLSGRVPLIPTASEIHVSDDGSVLVAAAYKVAADAFESLLVVDLKAGSFSYQTAGYAPIVGTTVSADGRLIAYGLGETLETAYGVYVNNGEKTLRICSDTDGVNVCYPTFSGDGQTLYFLDFSGETPALCRGKSNTAGYTPLLDGITVPDGTYRKTMRDCIAIYDPAPVTAPAAKTTAE